MHAFCYALRVAAPSAVADPILALRYHKETHRMTRRSSPTLTLAILVLLIGIAASAAHAPMIALAAAPPASCAPDSGSGTISGTVTAPGGVPLSGVEVTAYTIYGDRGGYAYSDASGNYNVTGLIAGSYIIQFKPSTGGYALEWYNNQPTALTAAPVTVSTGGTTSAINAQMELGARFSGQVVGEGAGPLQSAQVSVYDSGGQYVAGAYTDVAGNYTTNPGLATGSYRLSFESYSYLSEYYDDKPSLDTANVLAVTAPALMNGVNATLANGGKISGRVTSAATGLPLVNMSVSASGAGGSGTDYTDASGDYTIVGLGSGSYTVEAAPVFDDNLIGTPTTVAVTAPSTQSGVNFTMAPGGTLTGHVTDVGGVSLKDITVYVSNQDGSYQNYVSTNASGIYTATALPSGEYQAFFRPSAYIPEVYNDKSEYGQGDPIPVAAPNTVGGIDAVLEVGGAVRGTVTDSATGLPIKDIFVEVLDATGGRIESANTQADGTYQTATTLPSGSYKVRFNADERFASCAYVTAYYNNQLTETGADLVNIVAPNMVDHIDAALGRGSMIFGKVTDAATGAPITNGAIVIYNADGTNVMFGRLSFLGGYHSETGLPSGSYRVKFTDYNGGYIDEFYNDKSSLATANSVVLSAPNDITGIDAALAKGGLISGHVTASDTGAPFTDGSIVVYDTADNQVGYGQIQEDGSYTVPDGLASGNYRVAAVPFAAEGQGSASLARAQTRLASVGSQSHGYITTFYQGTVALSAATVVPVAAPNSTDGIDIAVLHGVLLPITQR
jgi:5-hydroxyisourate hydrolase-like protein (transthyretin family)